MVINPYVEAAVRKQRELRAMRLPSPQAEDHPVGSVPADFLEGLGAGGPKANMMRNILCSAAARRMTNAELFTTRAYLAAQRAREVAKLRSIGMPEPVLVAVAQPGVGDQVLAHEAKDRGLEW